MLSCVQELYLCPGAGHLTGPLEMGCSPSREKQKLNSLNVSRERRRVGRGMRAFPGTLLSQNSPGVFGILGSKVIQEQMLPYANRHLIQG